MQSELRLSRDAVAPRPIHRWGLLWRTRNRLDGERAHIVCDDGEPALFRTRAAARAYAKERYGYIATRPDLRTEPHGWQVPKAVRLSVSLEGWDTRRRG